MVSYKELLAQREKLEQQIAKARQAEVAGAVEQIRELVEQFELSPQDIFPDLRASGSASGPGKRRKPNAKYRDPVSGATWSGRGRAPKWLDGKSREKFLVASD